VTERAGAISLLEKIKDKFSRLSKIFSAAGYDGADFIAQFSLIISWIRKWSSAAKQSRDLLVAMDSVRTLALVAALQTVEHDYEVLPASSGFHLCRHGPVNGRRLA